MRLLPFLLLAACATGTAREADLSSELAGRTAGPAEDCVPASAGDSLVARDSRTLVYRRGDAIWVNRLAAACPGLDPMSTLIVDLHGSRYCRGDRFRTVDPALTIPGPTCLLGSFTPYRRQAVSTFRPVAPGPLPKGERAGVRGFGGRGRSQTPDPLSLPSPLRGEG